MSHNNNIDDIAVLFQGAKLLLVIKDRTLDEIKYVLESQNVFAVGINKWQDSSTIIPALPNDIEKHFIGHLQTNKVKYVVPQVDCIESVDSIKLANAIDKEGVRYNKIVPIFLQVNISADQDKYGFGVDEIANVLKAMQSLLNVSVQGLMTITAKQNMDKTRHDYRIMKELQIKYKLKELSMGMSADWKIAVEEGATIIRLGRALFE